MMNINSQHHNLLGSQISPKSEDFCIWRPFDTLVTMATSTILNFINSPKANTHYGGYSYKFSWSFWAKFGFQVDYDVANWYSSLVCYDGHF
jgi:hypothetical protein